jgi:hypothetical protein
VLLRAAAALMQTLRLAAHDLYEYKTWKAVGFTHDSSRSSRSQHPLRIVKDLPLHCQATSLFLPCGHGRMHRPHQTQRSTTVFMLLIIGTSTRVCSLSSVPLLRTTMFYGANVCWQSSQTRWAACVLSEGV